MSRLRSAAYDKHLFVGSVFGGQVTVYSPDGRVRVAVPLRIDDEAVRLAVLSRLEWIIKQQEKFSRQERQTPREYVSGESHYFQGARYRLIVIQQEGDNQVSVRNNEYIDFTVRPGSSTQQRQRVMSTRYRAHLKALIP